MVTRHYHAFGKELGGRKQAEGQHDVLVVLAHHNKPEKPPMAWENCYMKINVLKV